MPIKNIFSSSRVLLGNLNFYLKANVLTYIFVCTYICDKTTQKGYSKNIFDKWYLFGEI